MSIICKISFILLFSFPCLPFGIPQQKKEKNKNTHKLRRLTEKKITEYNQIQRCTHCTRNAFIFVTFLIVILV
ncbi:hypothetical protein GLYMA_19G258351v4 [Glycine max]|nr:hypothetical protein GLYMA_19G258351v4 [Glycine max]KAH1079602.1 hypothetical protein GYH30_054251 [Glycine max]